MTVPARSLTTVLSGDALIVQEYPLDNDGRRSFVELVGAADVAFTNLEVPLNDFHGPPEPGSSIYLSTSPHSGKELLSAGFNLFSVANNHVLDYGVEGLRRHVEALRSLGMPFAGVGETAGEAARPAYVDTPNGRVALVACASSLGRGWPAADPAPGVEGRPGLCPLRFDTRYVVNSATFEQARQVARAVGLEQLDRHDVAMGYITALPDPDRQLRLFGGVVELGHENRVETTPRRDDLERVVASVREAAEQADVVLVSLHTQEMLTRDEAPVEFTRTFARSCIDAGAHAIAMSGPHVLRGIELYRNAPILYSLGNLWFEYELIEHLPPESFEQHGLPSDATPDDFADHAMLGFQRDARFWETVLSRCVFAGGRLAELTLHPVTLGHGLPRGQRGKPSLASGVEATRILQRLAELSRPYGMRIELDGTVGRIRLP